MGRQILIHLHSSGTTEPNTSLLEFGEIAVQYSSEDSCLWIKDNEGNLAKFIESGAVQTMIDNSDSDIDCGFYYIPQYLTFEAVSANSTVKLNRIGTATTLQNAVLQYSIDNGVTWNDYTFTQQGKAGYSGDTITLSNVGDTVKFKGNNGSLGLDYSNYHKFVMTGKIKVSGDITSLNNEIGGDIPMSAGCYWFLFVYCASLTEAPNLPSTTLADNCYSYMFQGCTSLTTAPELPATTLANGCYLYMFNGCKSLETAPELNATTLAGGCYSSMFEGCTALTNVQSALPATTLANNCYSNMFNGCKSLETAPELPATTLANGCYSSMFWACNSLTTAPVLPATTLSQYCYHYMFSGCSNLNYINASFTTTPSTAYTNSWVSGVSQTGTFVKNSEATWDVTGVHGVPTGWTIETASS